MKVRYVIDEGHLSFAYDEELLEWFDSYNSVRLKYFAKLSTIAFMNSGVRNDGQEHTHLTRVAWTMV